MRLGTTLGIAVALSLGAGRAHAGEVVYTDNGWYQVAGDEPTPAFDPDDGSVTIEHAPPKAATAPTAFAPPEPIMPPPSSGPSYRASSPSMACLAERGALARRILELHGYEVSRIDLSDEQLGQLGTASAGASNTFNESFTLDPDLNLLSANVPIPPSSVNWDQETRERFQEFAACVTGG